MDQLVRFESVERRAVIRRAAGGCLVFDIQIASLGIRAMVGYTALDLHDSDLCENIPVFRFRIPSFLPSGHD